MKTILICGLPGSGKTTLAKELYKRIENCDWYNADSIRTRHNDWDFSKEGRERQMKRMKRLVAQSLSNNRHVICDFVCPTDRLRKSFNADYTIWMNTIKEGRFEDTNLIFENPDPDDIDFVITSDEWFPYYGWAIYWSNRIAEHLDV